MGWGAVCGIAGVSRVDASGDAGISSIHPRGGSLLVCSVWYLCLFMRIPQEVASSRNSVCPRSQHQAASGDTCTADSSPLKGDLLVVSRA